MYLQFYTQETDREKTARSYRNIIIELMIAIIVETSKYK